MGGLRVIVVVAGMSGILSGILLREAAIDDFVIYEKAGDRGGTWRENTYPGLSCDVPSHQYAYSFAPNPEWSCMFAPGAEIQDYFARTAREYGILSHIRFNKRVTAAEFAGGRWRVEFSEGAHDQADILIAATGMLHHPIYPDIAGLETFAGASFHTARWDHSAVLADRRVGVIGTGSTAVQLVTAIVEEVAELALFQRTAQWILPYPNESYSEADRAAFRFDSERMTELYRHLADQFNQSFARAVIGDEVQTQRTAERCERNLQANVHNAALRRQLTRNYKVACKRLIMSDGFYAAIPRPQARLITSAIECIEPRGVRTRDGSLHELDVLVLATGFDGHHFMRDIALKGPSGRTLQDAWAERTEAFRCVCLADFPNFFMLIGPNSPIGNFSLIMVAERQLDYILQLIEPIRCGECSAIASKVEATRAFNTALIEAMKTSVWVSGCRSWYLDRHGHPITWPWTFERFEADMAQANFEECDLIE